MKQMSVVGESMLTKMLFVCAGHTCRSPMAEVIARDLLAYAAVIPDGNARTRIQDFADRVGGGDMNYFGCLQFRTLVERLLQSRCMKRLGMYILILAICYKNLAKKYTISRTLVESLFLLMLKNMVMKKCMNGI